MNNLINIIFRLLICNLSVYFYVNLERLKNTTKKITWWPTNIHTENSLNHTMRNTPGLATCGPFNSIDCKLYLPLCHAQLNSQDYAWTRLIYDSKFIERSQRWRITRRRINSGIGIGTTSYDEDRTGIYFLPLKHPTPVREIRRNH